MSRITGKSRWPASIVYNALQQLDFPVYTFGAEVDPATVLSRIILPINYKIQAVAYGIYGTVGGSINFNIALGAGALGTQAVQWPQGTMQGPGSYPEDKFALPGQTLFAGIGPPVTMTSEFVSVIYPGTQTNSISNFSNNVVWPSGNELTLRATAPAGTTGSLKVVLAVTPVDQNPMSPEQYNQYFVPAANTL